MYSTTECTAWRSTTRDSRYSLRTRRGLTNTMKEITHSQVGTVCYCIFYFFHMVHSKISWTLFHFFLQWGWTSFQTWHLVNFESLSSGLSHRYSIAIHTGSHLHRCFFYNSEGLYLAYCLLQNCSATKGNYFSSNGPHPDSIDWRKKGNYVTDVKNQVKFNCTNIHTHILFSVIDLEGYSTLLLGKTAD